MPRVSLVPAACAAFLALAAPLGATLGAQAAPAAPAAPAGPPGHAGHAGHGAALPAAKAAPAASAADHEAEAHSGAWPAMDAFHQTLHAAWHPAAERKDLRPARAQARTLVARAAAWQRTAAPASCAGLPAGAVDSVAAGARAFAALAPRRGNDARAMAALRSLHARFEAAERACTGHGDAEHAGHGGPPR